VEDIFVFGGKTCGFQTNGQQDWWIGDYYEEFYGQ
jgi:hypothetical protein